MATTVKDVVERKIVATSPNNLQTQGNELLVGRCTVTQPQYFKVGQSYLLTDAAHPRGVSAELQALPGGGMQTATFLENTAAVGKRPAAKSTGARSGAKTAATNSTDFLPLPGLDVLGWGYDVTDHFANSTSVVQPLFAFGPFNSSVQININMPDGTTQPQTYAVPGALEVAVIAVSAGAGNLISEDSFSSFWSSFSSSVEADGQDGLFSGSLKADFSQTTFSTDDFAYSQQQYSFGQWRLVLPGPGTMQTMLAPGVQDDLNTMDPMALFDQYGPYYLSSIIVGGRLNYSLTTDLSNYASTTSVSAAVSLSWEGLGGATLSASQQEAVNTLNQSSHTSLSVVGGNAADAQQLLTGGGADALNKWFGSVAQNPVFCDFPDEDALTPIWALVTDADRAAKLQAAFPVWLQQKNAGFPPDLPWLQLTITQNMQNSGNDQHSGANDDLTIWQPALSPGDSWLGQSGQGDYGVEYTGSGGAVVSALSHFALRPPVGWNLVWEDHTSSDYYGCYTPIAPPGYVALSDFMRLRCSSSGPPTADESANMMCVHASLLTRPADIGDVIWNDQGSGAQDDMTLFRVSPVDPTKGYAIDTVVAAPNYSTNPGPPPAGINPFVLRIGPKIQLMDGSARAGES